jgi:hypothetical protein
LIAPDGGVDYKFGKIPSCFSGIRPTFRVASLTYYDYENFYFPDFDFSRRGYHQTGFGENA